MKRVVEQLAKAKMELAEILPTHLREEFLEKSFIGGGAIYSLHNNQEPKDYDFFVRDKGLATSIRHHIEYNSILRYKNGIMMGDYKGHKVLITDNAISFDKKYQIITRWVGTPEEVIGQFDFLHNMFYYEKNRVITLSAWKYLEDDRLYYNDQRARDICGTIIRVKKFVERGFTITNNEMAKMLLKLHEVGFNERELEILNSHDEERNNFGS